MCVVDGNDMCKVNGGGIDDENRRRYEKGREGTIIEGRD